MKIASDEIERLVETAAELRAIGSHWESIAAKVGRSPETCRRWPSWYPELWQRLYVKARASAVAEAGAEARAILRVQLRSKDEKTALAAAKILATIEVKLLQMQLRLPEPPREDTVWDRCTAHLKTLTPEQLESEANYCMDRAIERREEEARQAAAEATAAAAEPATCPPDPPQPDAPAAPTDRVPEPTTAAVPTPAPRPPAAPPASPGPAVASPRCSAGSGADTWNAGIKRGEAASPRLCRNEVGSAAVAGPGP